MTLHRVEAEVRAALVRLNRPAPGFGFDRTAAGDATPHVEGDGPMFDWVVVERGQEYARQSVDADELLFLALCGLTRDMAQSEEIRTRGQRLRQGVGRYLRGGEKTTIDDDYSRLTWMRAHERLMEALRPHWGERIAKEYRETLRRYPLTPAEQANSRTLDLGAFGLD